MSGERRAPEPGILVALLLMIVVPAILTLLAVETPRPPVPIPPDALQPSPYGYTWSCLLFIVPTAVLGWWVLAMHRGRTDKRAFWLSVGVLVPLWCLLDVFLGLTFFRFPNTGASIGSFWGYTFDSGWQKLLPLEEIVFYLFGFIAMLLVYIWGDAYWFKAYQKERPPSRRPLRSLISFHPLSLLAGIVLFGAAWAYKAFGPHGYNEGIPGYFLFMLLASILPSLLFYPVAKPFINWRSFMMASGFILLVSLFWEAVLAVPYGWWDYRPEQMMGVFVGPFTGLPLEAVMLWGFSSWTEIMIYETVHIVARTERATEQGSPAPGGREREPVAAEGAP